MDKVSVVFVDIDENYLMALEKKFSEELGGYINLSIITDMYYYAEYFNSPKDIDILVINEQLYSDIINGHNIRHIYILTENPTMYQENSIYNFIYKYTSVSDVFLQITSNETLKECINKSSSIKDHVITVYSPCGGSGKTTIALGLAISLARVGKKVMFLSTESTQSYSYILGELEGISSEFKNEMLKDKTMLGVALEKYIKNNVVDYLAPFKDLLGEIGVKKSLYLNVIEAIKAMEIYDYIIVDTDSMYDEELKNILNYSDKVLVIGLQDRLSAIKVNKFVTSEIKEKNDKYVFICNKYMQNSSNELLAYIDSFYVKDYIYFDESISDSNVSELMSNLEIIKLENII